jgi:hypothetical protein
MAAPVPAPAIGGYGEWAWQYREQGWVSVLPLPHRKKTPPPKDYTGQVIRKTGLAPHIPDDTQIAEWVTEYRRGNLCLRMPGDVIGIDVDAYEYQYHVKGDDKQLLYDDQGDPVMAWGLKTGDITIAEMEDQLGELPATWRSSSRTEGVSGIRLYRVPASMSWHDVGEHVETIWWGHRYAAVWPSINPDSDARYLWLDENDLDSGWGPWIPKVTDLPELPEAWVRHLSQETVVKSALVGPPRQEHADRPRFLGSHDPSKPRQFTRRQAADFVQPHLDELRHAGVGTINNRLNDAAKVISHFVPAVWPDVQARILLMDALNATAYDGKSWKADRTIESAFDSTLGDWRAQLVREPAHTIPRAASVAIPEPPDGDPGGGEATAGFWDAHPVLAYVNEYAISYGRNPWALLGVVIARAITATEPNIQLPPIGGTPGSLNCFIALVGKSGGGKSVTAKLGRRFLDARYGNHPLETFEAPLGSGEGLAHIYMKPPPARRPKSKGVDEDSAAIGLGLDGLDPDRPIQYRTRALIKALEIDALDSISDRRGSTLSAQLRTAWDADELGFFYSGHEKRLPTPEHGYRMSMLLGVQPGRAGTLLDEVDGGLPQRFLWVPCENPDLPEFQDGDEDAPLPDLPSLLWTPPAYQGVAMVGQDRVVRRDVRRNDRKLSRGEGDALDGHTMLNRLKAAAGLAFLLGGSAQQQMEITAEIWELSGVLMAVSDRTRDGVLRHLAEAARVANEKKGYAAAKQAIATEEVMEDTGIKKALRWLRGKIGDEWVTQSWLVEQAKSTISKYVKSALNQMLENGEIDAESYKAGGHETRKVRRREG